MTVVMNKPIDPRTTRRTVSYDEWTRNRALYFHWEKVRDEHDPRYARPVRVVIQRTKSWCESQAREPAHR